MSVPVRETPALRPIVTHQNELDEGTLLFLLNALQRKLYSRRRKQTTLVVHGGVMAVLGLKYRRHTTDVDYIERVLPEELDKSSSRRTLSTTKMLDTRTVIRQCIAETAAEFNRLPERPFVLEDDWMNSAAEVALPWYLDDENQMVDPLVITALADQEQDFVFESPGLRLVGITAPWTFALKLQRRTPADEDDIVHLLQKDGDCFYHTDGEFTEMVEERLKLDCEAMDYEHYPTAVTVAWRQRLLDCVRKAKFLGTPHSMI